MESYHIETSHNKTIPIKEDDIDDVTQHTINETNKDINEPSNDENISDDEQDKNKSAWKPEVLILGPGGVKGFMLLGSLLFFENTQILSNVHTIVGVSIGSLIGLLYVIGCSVVEMLELALSTSIMDIFMTSKLSEITKGNGLFSHDLFRLKLSSKLIERFGLVPTLKQLYMMSGYNFVSVVTNLDQERPEYLSHETEPDLSVIEAVLMSINIPIFFHMYKYKKNLYIDGGIACPIPIEKYDDGNTDILIMILKDDKIDPQSSFINYFIKIIQFMVNREEKRLMCGISNRCKYITFTSTETREPIGFELKFENRVSMVISGYIKSYEFYEDICENYPDEYNIDYSKIVPVNVFKLHQMNTKQPPLKYVNGATKIQTPPNKNNKKQEASDTEDEDSSEYDSEELADDLLEDMFSDIIDSEEESSDEEDEEMSLSENENKTNNSEVQLIDLRDL